MNGKRTMVGALRAAFGALAACLVAARALLAAALAQATGNDHRRRGGGLGQGEIAASIPPMGVPLDTIVDRDGQRVLQVGSSFYPMPGGNAYLLVLDRKSVAGDSVAKAAFDQLPLGSSVDSALADKLKPYVSDTARYLAVLTGPTGAGNGSAILPHDKPFSYVFPIVSGIDDLKSIGDENYGGVKNIGLQLQPSGRHSIPGELFGYLQRAGVGHLFSFVRTENVPFETRTQLTTLVAPAPVAPRDGHQYLLVSALGTALDVRGGSTTRGERLVANGRTGLGSQRWALHGGPDGGGDFELENANSSLCAEVADASKDAGASVVQSPCDHALNQRWRPIPVGDGSYLLASVSNGLVLSVQGNSAEPETPVVQDSYRTGAKGQAWRFQPVPGSTPVDPAAHGVYVLASRAGPVLGIADASTGRGAAAVAEEESDLPAQRWALYPDPEAPQYFQLINVNSGLCLDVTGASKEKRAAVAQWPCDSGHEQENQLWQPLPQPGGGYALRNVNSGMVLTIGAGSQAPANAVVQDTDSGAPGQHWIFVPMVAEPQDYGVYVLSSPLGPAVDLAGGSATPGTPGTQVAAADERDGSTQQWLAVPAGSANFPSSARVLVNVRTGLCLTVPGSSKAENTRLDQQRCAPNYDDPSQLWDARRQADGSYVLANVSSGLVLSVAAASAAEGPAKPGGRAGRERPDQERSGEPQAAARTIWYTSGKKDLTDPTIVGYQDYYSSDFVPSGRANHYPYLVREGDSFAYRNLSTEGVDVSANLLASDQMAGKLSITYSSRHVSGNYALQIQLQCTSDSPYFSVSSLGPESVDATSAQITAEVTNGALGDYDFYVEYGPSEAVYTNRSAVHQESLKTTGTRRLSLSLSGLQPGTTYHYRIVGETGGVKSYSGADQTFTTTAYGTPIVQAADKGARSQRWLFRPLARTLTMTVGADDYSLKFPLSWSGFAVLWLDAALRPLVRNTPLLPSYTNTGSQDFDRGEQDNLARGLLEGIAEIPGSTVLIQSVGAPHPSTDRWGAVGRAIASPGGNEQVFDHLDGSQGYALVGCSSCEPGQPEASGAPGADELAGVLSRGFGSTYRAQLADAQGSTGFGLLPLAYQEPGSWPVPATPGQAKAFAWVSQQLGLGNPNATDTKTWCYVPADWDVRAQYCTSEKWDDERIDLARLVAPSDQGFTEADFKAVVSALDQEFEWISGVQDMISNLQRVFLSSESTAGFDLTKAATDVRDAVGGDGDVRLDVLELQAEMIDAASLLAPEGVEQAMGLVAAGMSIASTVSQESDGSKTLGEIQTKASELGTELSKRYAAAQSNLGLAFNLLVTDHAKLMTAYLQHKGGAWQFGYPLSDDMTDAFSLATKRWLYTELIPTAYDQYRFWTPSGMGLDNIGCIQAHGGGTDWYYPFDEMPGNGQFRPITNFDSSGRPEMAQLWGLGKGDPWNNAPDFKKPPASLVDPLFAPPSSRGLGLSKVRFFTSAPFPVKDCTGGLASNCRWRTPDAD